MSAGGRVPKSRMEQSMNARTQRRDLTTGPAGKQIFLFALPLLGASLIQQLYNTVDLLFVGNILGTEATAAVGASSLLTSCIVGFFTGLSIGTGVVISLAEGQGRREKIRKTVHTADRRHCAYSGRTASVPPDSALDEYAGRNSRTGACLYPYIPSEYASAFSL